MTPRSEPPPVRRRPWIDTGQIRLYLLREPARVRGTAQLIRALCDEVDRLRRELRALGGGAGEAR